MVTLTEQTAQQQAYRAKLRDLEQRVGRLERDAMQRARAVLEQVRQDVLEELQRVPPERFRAFFLHELKGSIEQRLAALAPRLTQELNAKILAAIDAGEQSVSAPLAVYNVSIPFMAIAPNVVDVVQGFTADLIQRLSDETRARINADLSTAILRGDSIVDAARQIGRSLHQPATTFSAITDRAERIARTEILRAYSIAQQASLRQVAEFVPGLQKQWVATQDDRTRPDHRLAHGQLRNWNAPFDVGGEALMYPRDPGASPENTINCRCVSVPVLPEFAQDAALEPPAVRQPLPRFEERPLPWLPPPLPRPTVTPVAPAVQLQRDVTLIGRRERSLRELLSTPITSSEPLKGTGITPNKFKVQLASGQDAIFKAASDVQLHGITPGTDALRERAAYLVSRHLGFDNVPATQLRQVEGQTGSIQLWVNGVTGQKAYYSPEWPHILRHLDADSLQEMAVLDYVINNRDRHAGNFLLVRAGDRYRVVAIDNGLSFAPARDRWMNQESYGLLVESAKAGGATKLSARLMRQLQRVNQQALVNDLRQTGLTPSEITSALRRLQQVQQYGLAALFRFPVSALDSGLIAAAKRRGILT